MPRNGIAEPDVDLEPSPRIEALDITPEILARSTLPDIQHTDAHLLHIDRAADRSAEQWARAIMEEVPAEVRTTLERAWQSIALRLTPGAPRTVAGWSIAHSGTDYVLLQAESALDFEGQLLFERRENTVLLATFVRYRDPAASTVWERALPSHLGFVRALLERVAQFE
ncbi:hypothetical protein ACFYTQ_03050 [Nocardia sp. NPDC004068]|uniref:hypothetical protein n=1 Tax=Nocardia sp. NPDC004068 TaxID=3364303 RepID=UPI0036B80352